MNNLIYTVDTTLMAEEGEELKGFLMRVKEESENTDLKLNIQKTNTMISSPITSWQKVDLVTDFILFGSKDIKILFSLAPQDCGR